MLYTRFFISAPCAFRFYNYHDDRTSVTISCFLLHQLGGPIFSDWVPISLTSDWGPISLTSNWGLISLTSDWGPISLVPEWGTISLTLDWGPISLTMDGWPIKLTWDRGSFSLSLNRALISLTSNRGSTGISITSVRGPTFLISEGGDLFHWYPWENLIKWSPSVYLFQEPIKLT